MKLLCTLFSCLVFSPAFSQPDLVWAKTFTATESISISHSSTDSLGNILVTGGFSGTVHVAPGSSGPLFSGQGGWFAKLDPLGNPLWTTALQTAAWPNVIYNWKIVPDNLGNVYLSGSFTGTVDMDPGPNVLNMVSDLNSQHVFVARYNSSGGLMWYRSFGNGTDSYANDLVADKQGNVFVTGLFGGTVDFDPGPAQSTLTKYGGRGFFILKLNGNGDLQWVHGSGNGAQENAINALAIDKNGSVLAAGNFQEQTDFDPGPGTTWLNCAGRETFIFKMNTFGVLKWAKVIASPASTISPTSTGFDMALDNTGNIYVGGIFGWYAYNQAGSTDAYVCRLDSLGNVQWLKKHTGNANIGATSLSLMSNRVFICGHSDGAVDADPGPAADSLRAGTFIVGYDLAGQYQCSGTIKQDYGFVSSAVNGFHLAGEFGVPLDLDPGPGTQTISSATRASYIAKYLDCTGLTQVPEQSVAGSLVYPVPNQGTLHFSKAPGAAAKLRVYDVSGSIVKTCSGPLDSIDLSELPRGIYLLDILEGDIRSVYKVIRD